MTPEERRILIETRDLAQENAEILRSMRRTIRLNTFMKVLYWVVILGISFGAYYLIQPYVEAIGGTFGVTEAIENIKSVRGL